MAIFDPTAAQSLPLFSQSYSRSQRTSHHQKECLSFFCRQRIYTYSGMASKKVIAICQSGGEFVTNKDGSLTYNEMGSKEDKQIHGDAYAVDIDETTKLSDFRKEVAE